MTVVHVHLPTHWQQHAAADVVELLIELQYLAKSCEPAYDGTRYILNHWTPAYAVARMIEQLSLEVLRVYGPTRIEELPQHSLERLGINLCACFDTIESIPPSCPLRTR